MMVFDIDKVLDATGLRCPLPLLKAKQTLGSLPSGGQLKVLATDPGSLRDFRAWTEHSGHELISAVEDNGSFTYIVRKKT